MKLETVTSYTLDGKEFSSLRDAKTHLENEVGRILDAIPHRLPALDALAVFNAIVKNKERLAALLSVTVESDAGEPVNLLDIP